MAILEPYGFKETHTDDWVGIKLRTLLLMCGDIRSSFVSSWDRDNGYCCFQFHFNIAYSMTMLLALSARTSCGWSFTKPKPKSRSCVNTLCVSLTFAEQFQ